MSKTRAYLDYNASAPLRPAARETMVEALSHHGNASSVHGEGRDMRRLIERARGEVAALVNADVEGVVFTSSATEAAHLALSPELSVDGDQKLMSRLYVLETEHPCVLAGGRFSADKVTSIPVLPNGLIDLQAFDDLLLREDGVPFVAVQLVNSETGIIQPVSEVANRIRLKNGFLLCDAVQAVGRMPIDVKTLGADFVLISAHKLGGPHGAAALINVHQSVQISAAIGGGGQEKNQRAGTENVAAIVGFGAAAVECHTESQNYSAIIALRDSIEDALHPICTEYGLDDRLSVFGQDVERAGNTVLFSVNGLKAETALIAFDLEGVALSSGSACSSGKVGSSHVLQAMKVDPEVARGAIRVSVGWDTTSADVEKFIVAFQRIAKRLRENLGETNETEISGAA